MSHAQEVNILGFSHRGWFFVMLTMLPYSLSSLLQNETNSMLLCWKLWTQDHLMQKMSWGNNRNIYNVNFAVLEGSSRRILLAPIIRALFFRRSASRPMNSAHVWGTMCQMYIRTFIVGTWQCIPGLQTSFWEVQVTNQYSISSINSLF